jgi:hypothetical protein
VVDRLVVSFDKAHRGWGGGAIPVDDCLEELRRIDCEAKIDLRPGDFSHPELPPGECETRERQAALDVASEGADWVVQLDGDEVIPNLRVLVEMIERADAVGAVGLDYPSRWIYARIRGHLFLEGSSRWWRPAAGYPGPLAVRAGSKLSYARQCNGDLFRVDFRATNTDPWRSRAYPVHATVPVDAGVLHFSWVRTLAEMNAKAEMSPHRDDVNWHDEIRRWQYRQRHPWLATALTPFRRRGKLHPQRLRIVRLPLDPPARLMPLES